MLSLGALLLAIAALASCQAASASPQTIRLTARQNPKRIVARRALAPVTVPLTDYFNGTDLQWYGAIQIGTPPQNLTVVFDTGSVTLEVVSTACGQPCANQAAFDSTKSSTFVDGGKTNILTFGTGVGVDPVVGNNWQLRLRSATDTVTVGGISVANISMFLITDQTPTFASDPFSGIQGMSPSADGLFAGLVEQGLPSLFSFYLTPHDVGDAQLTLGAIDNSKFQGELTYASLTKPESSFWQLESSDIIVNQNSVAVNSTRLFLFDSGTSSMLMPKEDAEAIYALISPKIQPFSDEPDTYGIPCSEVASLPAEITFVFTSQSGDPFNLTIPSSEFSVGPFKSNPDICQALINTMDDNWIVGASLFKHYYSVWDLGGKRLGFAPTVSSVSGSNGTSGSNTNATSTSTPTTQSFSGRNVPEMVLLGLSALITGYYFI